MVFNDHCRLSFSTENGNVILVAIMLKQIEEDLFDLFSDKNEKRITN